LQVLRVQRKTQ